MDLRGKRVMIFGGAGLVGRAIARRIAGEGIRDLILAGLTEREAAEAADALRTRCPTLAVQHCWGNLFVRHALKDIPPGALLADPTHRTTLIHDLTNPFSREILTGSTIFQLLNHYRPDVLIDAVNTATGIAYQNIFGTAFEAAQAIGTANRDETTDILQRLLCTLYTPQLIRHVQILRHALVEHHTQFYLKIGTCGTGGMGLNIPYTHSEDKPSQMLLAKAALAGAHSQLLFLMARTPGGPIIKELKPAAAIAWKRIGVGPISKGGRTILLEATTRDDAVLLRGTLQKRAAHPPRYLQADGRPKVLIAPHIDTGENGLFALGEFETLTEEGQMEFITPEEIAQCAVWEILGRNTGHDIVAALDNSTLGPTYRAGQLRQQALDELNRLVSASGLESIAFEQLGPPRLSKLLYEGHLLQRRYHTFEAVLAAGPAELAHAIESDLFADEAFRARIVSIGIPILLADGQQLLRGQTMAVPTDPPGRHDTPLAITPEAIDRWAHDGWIDLRAPNWGHWQNRLRKILADLAAIPPNETSSALSRGRHYWGTADGVHPIAPAKLASWIFIHEEHGSRMKG
ncbi:MAG: short-chain dehydrogenase [Deltaproteobacteria bacterium]|nr:short-chain dehydrogenase [Deltaproteobacteria bacterium]